MPNVRPIYSQLSFTLLSYALIAACNKTYLELLKQFVFTPFNLTNSGVSPGNTSLAAIPPINNSWGSDYGDNAPGGGLYSSLNDLSILLHSILDRSALRTETQSRAWLKPHSTTSSIKSLVGRPWEIYRSQNLTPKYPHTIDLYAKNGAAVGYAAQVSVIDQYGLGVVILTAGGPEAWGILYDAILATIVPAVEDEARYQAKQYAGNWTGIDSLGVDNKLSLALDDGPGLKLEALTRGGEDILAAMKKVYTLVLPQFGKMSEDFRIFPADMEISNSTSLRIGNETYDVVREDWRINLDFSLASATTKSDLPGQRLRNDDCISWQSNDWFYWGGEAVDRIIVLKDKGGRVVGIELPFLRAILTKELR